jgi:hypothetical protein
MLGLKLTQKTSEHWPVDDESRKEKICGDFSGLNQALWKEMDTGSWLTTTYAFSQTLGYIRRANTSLQIGWVGIKNFL